LNLRRCIRLYPHQNNSGGFFIAVLKKISETNLNIKTVENVPLNPFSKKSATIGDDLEEFMKLVGYKDTEKEVKTEKIEVIQEVEEKSSEEVVSMNSYVNFREYDDNFANV
jgi:Sec7-like guanine-nucleotide exchange factor